VPSLIFFCDAVISWDPTPADLQLEFHTILHSLKDTANGVQAGKWDEFVVDVSPGFAVDFSHI
jgi:hypothetical protein